MAVTADQVLTAFQAEQGGQQLAGTDSALAGLMRTPDFSSMDVSQEDYYNMDEAGQAAAIAQAVSNRLSGSDTAPASPTPQGTPQNASESVTEPSRGIPEEPQDDYIPVGFQDSQDYLLDWEATAGKSEEPTTIQGKSDNLAKASVMDSYSKGRGLTESMLDIYSQGSEADSRQTLKAKTQEKAYTELADINEAAEQMIVPDTDNESILETIEVANEMKARVRQEQQAYFTAFVDSFAGAEVEQGVKENLVAQAALYDVASRTFDDMGWGEKTWEFFRSFIPGMDTKDALKFSGGDFDPQQFARNFYNNFQELDYEDKIKAIPELQRALEDKVPRGQAARMLQALASPSGEITVAQENDLIESLAFDAVDIIPIVAAVGARGFKAMRGLKGVKDFNKEEVSDVMAIAATDKSSPGVGSSPSPAQPGTSLSTDVWEPAYEDIRGLLPDGRRRIERGITIEGEGEWVDDPGSLGGPSAGRPSADQPSSRFTSASEARAQIVRDFEARSRAAKSFKGPNTKTREAAAVDSDSLGATLTPFYSEWLDTEQLLGLSNSILQRLKRFELRNREYGQAVESDEAFLKESFLSDEQAKYAERNIQLQYEKTDGLENVRTERINNNTGVRVTYDTVDENGNIVSNQEVVEFSLDDVQEMEFKDPGTIRRHLGGALAWMTGDLKDIAKQFIRAESGNAKVLSDLRKLQDEAYSAILGKNAFSRVARSFSPKQRKRIDKINDVLLSGDENQVVYSVDELKEGIAGHKLDDAEIETYYKLRIVLDNLFFMRNSEKRRELVLRGIKEATMSNGTRQLGRPLTDASAASNSIGKTNSKWFYDDVDGQPKRFEDIDLSDEYMNGKQLIRLDESADLAGDGNEVRYAMVSTDQLSNLPAQVLHRRIGYVPKINNEGAYFVKVFTPKTVDGTTIPATENRANVKTVRAFNNKKEADAWAEQQNIRLREEGVDVSDMRFQALEDRQLELERTATALDSPASLVGGGLYTGPRSSEEILWGAEGLKQPRLNAFEATSRALTATSKYVSMNQLRIGAQERALRTANMLRAEGGSPLNAPFQSFDDLRHVAPDTENNRKIRSMYTYVQDALGFPTTEEKLFKRGMQNIIDNSGLAKKMPGFEKSAFYLKSKDPIASARAAAFHGLLGWFNPAQLWVQAQGAAVAASMNIFNPVALGRSIRNQFALQALHHVDNNADNIAHVAKAMGMSADELAEMNQAWLKTGLKDAILTTADHAAADAGSGVTLGALRRTEDKGLFFYRGGELFNRRLSFVTAFDEFKRANKGASITDESLRSILTRSNNLMLNMNRANRASWQKGIWSLPTQFNQINFRTIEALLGVNGDFTMAERGKILAGQAAFYGAAGIPLGNLGAQWMMEMFGYTQEELEKNVDPKTIKAANEGFLGWLTMATFGIDVEIGERSSLIGGLQSFTSDLLFSEGTVSDKLFGAFGNVGGRFWPALMGEYEPLSLGLAEGRVVDPLKIIASPLIGSISTFRNIDKAFAMNQFHKIMDKSYGTTVMGPFSPAEEAAAVMGFQLKDEAELWDLRESNKAREEYRKKMVTEIVKRYHQFALKSMHGQLTDEYKDQVSQEIAFIIQDFNPYERRLVRESVQSKLTNGQSQLSKEWKEYRMLQGNGEVDRLLDYTRLFKTPGAELRSALSGGGIPVEGGFEDEEVIGNGE